MAFLDRLVSDLVHKSTGFNARPFVRRIGGKNLLLLGGAAIAGALAAEKARESRGGASAGPPPPPPPRAGTGPPPPPPVPRAEAEDALPKALLYAIVRTMVAAALADGEMHGEEKELIESRLDESGLSSDQIRQVQKDMVIPPSASDLAALARDDEERALLYRFAALVVLADGERSELETSWLAKLGTALGLDAETRSGLEREIFDAG